MTLESKETPKSKQDATNEAIEFARSMRGQYIIGQALAIAKEQLGKAEYPEVSNMADMEFLGNTIFQIGYLPTNMQLNNELSIPEINDDK
tara:strand:- start:490 stop:759 length:270 start_codon:yes stop_codon:yes gene_type:complete